MQIDTKERSDMTNVMLRVKGHESLALAVEWCQANVGVENYEIESAWPADILYFKFRDPIQATLFKLRWSQ